MAQVMISKSLHVVLTVLLILGAIATAHAQAAEPRLSVAVQAALVEAQIASKKADLPAALAAVEKARAVSGRTPYDDLQINRYKMSLLVQQRDLIGAAVEAEAAADMDPVVIPDAEKGPVYTAGLQLALNAKHYDKAARYAKLVQSTTPPPDESIMAMAAQAMYLGSDYAGAIELAQKNIAAAKAAGKVPARTDFEVLMSAQVQQNNQAAAEQTLEQMVAIYNDPKDLAQLQSARGKMGRAPSSPPAPKNLSTSPPPPQQTQPAASLNDAKAKCADLGFKAGTEKFGECVLKLSK